MPNDNGQNTEYVFLVVTSDDGKKLYKGNVKINYPNLNLGHGIRLLKMPPMTLSNPGGQSHGTGFTGSNPKFSPIVAQVYLESSVPLAFPCCMKGKKIGQVIIYQLVSSGKDLTVLSTYTLENARIIKVGIVYDSATDQLLGHGAFALVTLTGTAFGTTQSVFDEEGKTTGKVGAQIDKNKGIVTEVAG